jgi:protein TonB
MLTPTGGPAARSVPWAHGVRIRPALALCLLLSLAAHVALLALSRGSSVRPGDGAASRRGSTLTVTVRVEPEATLARHVQEARPAAPDAPDTNAASLAPRPPKVPALTLSSEPVAASAADKVTAATMTDGGVEYLPRGLLSVVPIAEGPVAIPYPRDGPAQGRFTTVLALFIDEDGIVRRVRVDGPSLPPALDAAAREAFLAARWQPGQFEGRVVKSLIHVEVSFESGPAALTGHPLE